MKDKSSFFLSLVVCLIILWICWITKDTSNLSLYHLVLTKTDVTHYAETPTAQISYDGHDYTLNSQATQQLLEVFKGVSMELDTKKNCEKPGFYLMVTILYPGGEITAFHFNCIQIGNYHYVPRDMPAFISSILQFIKINQ